MEEALQRMAEELARGQAADEQMMAKLDQMDEVLRRALQKTSGFSAVGTHAIQTMAVLRASQRMRADAIREFLRSVDAERRA
jgi:DNA repair protein RadC